MEMERVNLKLAGIGTPQNLISSILQKGSYEPFVPLGSIRRNQKEWFCWHRKTLGRSNIIPPSMPVGFFDSQLCYPGFLAWNNFWKNSYSREIATSNLDALSNVP